MLHPLSQPESQQSDSQPQAGSSQPQAGSSQPQAGSSQPQAGSSQPQAGSSQPQAGSSQPQAGSHPQAGSSHPQAGSSQPQAGSQAASQHPVSQHLAELPQPFTPSIRSKRSNPKLWLHIVQPRTSAIVIIVRFIGATSPLISILRFGRYGIAVQAWFPHMLRERVDFGGAFDGRSRRRAHLEFTPTNTNGSGADTRPADFVQFVVPAAGNDQVTVEPFSSCNAM